jgi:hypothetical protein
MEPEANELEQLASRIAQAIEVVHGPAVTSAALVIRVAISATKPDTTATEIEAVARREIADDLYGALRAQLASVRSDVASMRNKPADRMDEIGLDILALEVQLDEIIRCLPSGM